MNLSTFLVLSILYIYYCDTLYAYVFLFNSNVNYEYVLMSTVHMCVCAHAHMAIHYCIILWFASLILFLFMIILLPTHKLLYSRVRRADNIVDNGNNNKNEPRKNCVNKIVQFYHRRLCYKMQRNIPKQSFVQFLFVAIAIVIVFVW